MCEKKMKIDMFGSSLASVSIFQRDEVLFLDSPDILKISYSTTVI